MGSDFFSGLLPMFFSPVAGLAGSLFGGSKNADTPTTPVLQTPVKAPSTDDAAVQKAAADAADEARKRRGRAATILTEKAGSQNTTGVGLKPVLGE